MARTFWLCLMGLMFVAGPALAESKVAVLDVVQVVNASEANKAAGQKMRQKSEDIKAKIAKMRAPLQERERSLNERRSMLTDDQFNEEQRSLREDIRDFKFEAEEMERALKTEVLKHNKEIAEAVNDIVADVAQEQGFDVVVPRNILLFADNTVDISAEVLERLNKRLK